MESSSPPMPTKGPYRPTTWSLGGSPEVKVDVPVSAIFLAFFIGGAVTHMTILQKNNRKGHKFLFSGLLFGFCMARIVSCIMRIASVTLPHNLNLAIAAQIFVAAGVVILFIVNLAFAQRMIRASHPHIGWKKSLSLVFKFLYALVILTIIMLITTTIQSFFTLRPRTKTIDRGFMLYGVTTFAILSFLPIPIVLASVLIPRRSHPLDKFGAGHWRSKIYILLLGTTLICFGACYRAATSWQHPTPMTQPLPAYDHKGAFYIANFTVEVLTIYLYAFGRVDQRWHVPDGAGKRRSYRDSTATDLEGAYDEQKDVEAAPAAAHVTAPVASHPPTRGSDQTSAETEKSSFEKERDSDASAAAGRLYHESAAKAADIGTR